MPKVLRGRLTSALMPMAALAFTLLTGSALAQAPGTISVQDAHAAAQAGRMVLVDIRTVDEWRETGLPASAHAVTMHQPSETLLQGLDAAVVGDRSRAIGVICATGNRSSRLRTWLSRNGFTNVVDVSEGMIGGRHGPGWLRSGLPIRRWDGRATPDKTAAPQ